VLAPRKMEHGISVTGLRASRNRAANYWSCWEIRHRLMLMMRHVNSCKWPFVTRYRTVGRTVSLFKFTALKTQKYKRSIRMPHSTVWSANIDVSQILILNREDIYARILKRKGERKKNAFTVVFFSFFLLGWKFYCFEMFFLIIISNFGVLYLRGEHIWKKWILFFYCDFFSVSGFKKKRRLVGSRNSETVLRPPL